MSRLTTGAKLLLIVVVLGVLFAGWKFVLSPKLGLDTVKTEAVKSEKKGFVNPFSKNDSKTNDSNSNSNLPEGALEVINIGVVTWGGYAGGEYFNEGFDANTKSRFYTEYGFKVNFMVIDDFDASRSAFKEGTIDLMWGTIDAFPTEIGGLAKYDPQFVFQADWSRGGDAAVVRRGINSVEDLRGKKIAFAPMTPSHSFLLWILDAGGLTMDDIIAVEVPSAIDAADAFKSSSVDCAIVWSPDDKDCVTKVPGSRILESTKNASHIIADGFIAKKQFIQNNKKQLIQLYEGWMIGASEINTNTSAKNKAASILSEGLNQPVDFCIDAINNVRLATHGDNLNFFGINREYTGVCGEDLYNKMKSKYSDIGYNTLDARSWRLVTTNIITKVNLTGSQHNSEAKKVFKMNQSDFKKDAISTKKVSISFRSGEYILDDNSKYIIDNEFTPIAKAFSNAKIRIEGNTDDTGSRELNLSISKKRAQSVANYLVSQWGMSAQRFIVVGNGPDKPISTNSTNTGRSKNRRTDFELIAD